ncbi:Uncharacterised protein [Legionella steigerwaltii]|uniref:Uncharacterized protein n=1 Tax=Legionella steigerwaltii TaxID=460 RepID=A0A378L6Y3_9GAMM|nr:hypothetical protein Lstg_2270 [Legionella steigerwaltii]STY22467.1 Uncharacterised protein [Legionella steigerwaltii]
MLFPIKFDSNFDRSPKLKEKYQDAILVQGNSGEVASKLAEIAKTDPQQKVFGHCGILLDYFDIPFDHCGILFDYFDTQIGFFCIFFDLYKYHISSIYHCDNSLSYCSFYDHCNIVFCQYYIPNHLSNIRLLQNNLVHNHMSYHNSYYSNWNHSNYSYIPE